MISGRSSGEGDRHARADRPGRQVSSDVPVSRTRPAPPGPVARAVGLVRLVHPLPSFLDAAIVAGLAVVAGGGMAAAVRAAAAMLLLQFSIGATNDLVDAPVDRGVAAGKTIPAGLVTPAVARRVALAAATGGLVLAAAGGPASLAVGGAGLAVGLAYDLWLKGTAWSWLPYALGIPLLVTFGWAGAGLPVPGFVALLAPLAAVAGAQLAIGNALVDLERDRAAGLTTVATSLGLAGARRLLAVLATVVVVAAWLIVDMVGGRGTGLAAVAAGSAVIAVGAAGSGHDSELARRRAWEIQGAGLGLLALGLTAALLSGGRL